MVLCLDRPGSAACRLDSQRPPVSAHGCSAQAARPPGAGPPPAARPVREHAGIVGVERLGNTGQDLWLVGSSSAPSSGAGTTDGPASPGIEERALELKHRRFSVRVAGAIAAFEGRSRAVRTTALLARARRAPASTAPDSRRRLAPAHADRARPHASTHGHSRAVGDRIERQASAPARRNAAIPRAAPARRDTETRDRPIACDPLVRVVERVVDAVRRRRTRGRRMARRDGSGRRCSPIRRRGGRR